MIPSQQYKFSAKELLLSARLMRSTQSMETTHATPPRPRSVQRGIALLAASVALGIPRSAMEWPKLLEEAAKVGSGPAFILGTQAFSFVIVGGLLLLAWYRHNWARWVYAVLTVLGIPFSIMPLVYALSTSPVSGVLGIIQVAMQISGLIYSFKPESSAWYKWRKPAASEAITGV
jgi:hypothetical protein